MKRARQIAVSIFLTVCLLGTVWSPAAADGGKLVPLAENQKMFISEILIMQVEGAFQKWDVQDKQALVRAMLENGILTENQSFDEMFPSELSVDQIASLCDTLLLQHYGKTSFASFLSVMEVDWPENTRTAEDQRWFSDAALTASKYGDTIAQADDTGKKPIENKEQAIEHAHGTMMEIYDYSQEALAEFVFTANEMTSAENSEPVWRIQCYQKDEPASIYTIYFSQDGTFITAERP